MKDSSAGFLLRGIKVLIVISVIAMAVWGALWIINKVIVKRTTLSISGHTFQVEVADNDWIRSRGLSGRNMIKGDEAMLFVADKPDYYKIWMKDMRFSIDVLWLNEDKKVVHVERQLRPDSHPHKTYSPSVPAKYVVEMAAGKADELNVRIGSRVIFDIEEKS